MTNGPADAGQSHAARMNRMYRTQRHIYDITRKYYLLGRDHTIRSMDARPGETVLELGCGTGRNLKLVAQAYPQSLLYGLDISEEMLISARKAVPGAIRLAAGDAATFTAEDFGVSGFDHILISYALSMIPAWQETIDRAISALNPGGKLHIVDFGQQEGLPSLARNSLQAWLSRFHVTPRENLAAVTADIARRHGAASRFRPLYRGYAWAITVTGSGNS